MQVLGGEVGEMVLKFGLGSVGFNGGYSTVKGDDKLRFLFKLCSCGIKIT